MERELDVMREMIRLVGTRAELAPTLGEIARGACDFLGADNGTIGLVQSGGGSIRIEAAHRMPVDELGSVSPIGVGLAGTVLKTRRPVRLDRYDDIQVRPRTDLVENAILGVPIWWGEELIGVFGLGAAPPRRFDERDVARLEIFARYAAAVIRHKQLDADNEARLRDLRLLYDTSRSIAQALGIDEVISAYLDQVAARGSLACSVVLYEPDAKGDRAWNVLRGRWSPEEGRCLEPIRFPHREDALDLLLDRGETVRISNVHYDPRADDSLRAMQLESGRPALAMVPLMVHGNRIGLVVLASARESDWSDAELAPFETTAYLLATTIDSRREHWRAVEQSREIVRLQERQRLARDLHDSVTQSMFGVVLTAEAALAGVPAALPATEQKLARVVEMGRVALGEMRSLLNELHPQPGGSSEAIGSVERLRIEGLREALAHQLASLPPGSPRTELRIGHYERQKIQIEEGLMRIAQEALSNAVRHARASHVCVSLDADPEWVELSVRDDGVGMNEHEESSGYGLVNMLERATALGGMTTIESCRGLGTTVRVRLPR